LSLSPKNKVDAKITNYPCESLHPGVESLLNALHLSRAIEVAVGKYKEIEINNQLTSLCSDRSGDWEGTHICREIFNAYFLSAAQLHGIIVIDDIVTGLLSNNDRVISVTINSGKSFLGSFIIDGSGRKRLAGKKMKFREAMYSPPLTAWSGVVDCGDKHLRKDCAVFIPAEDGWIWLAPHADNYCTWTRVSRTHYKKLESLRIIKQSPHWIPAHQNGKNVKSYFSFRITTNYLGKTTCTILSPSPYHS